jgi:hypothetical protein
MTAFVIDQDCNPVQRRMAQDASATQGPIGSPEPDKTRATGRIDDTVAALKALGRANEVRQESTSP